MGAGVTRMGAGVAGVAVGVAVGAGDPVADCVIVGVGEAAPVVVPFVPAIPQAESVIATNAGSSAFTSTITGPGYALTTLFL